jgi:hypothetical protein
VGYKSGLGGEEVDQHLVCAIDYFVGRQLHYETPGKDFRYISPNVTVVELDSDRVVHFPFEAVCERANCTLEGRSEGSYSKIGLRGLFVSMESGEVSIASLSVPTDVELGAGASGATAEPTSGADVVPEPTPISAPNVEPVRTVYVDSLGGRYPCDEFGYPIRKSKRPTGVDPVYADSEMSYKERKCTMELCKRNPVPSVEGDASAPSSGVSASGADVQGKGARAMPSPLPVPAAICVEVSHLYDEEWEDIAVLVNNFESDIELLA